MGHALACFRYCLIAGAILLGVSFASAIPRIVLFRFPPGPSGASPTLAKSERPAPPIRSDEAVAADRLSFRRDNLLDRDPSVLLL